ncbi:MAG: sulfatase-like hydrolase/transferase, partial [Acidobacteria bacterium]|nr:sulfatase-like hydrolase/transferase [Acidobacteriota bacterium]
PLWRPQLNGQDKLFLLRQYRNRLESLRAVDDLVGRVFEALTVAGELDRTVVFFTSDNGFLYGEHRLGEKLVAYEESIRVPLYVRVPGRPGPLALDQLVLNTDLAPTIADLAGVAPGLPVDGRSLVPLLAGPVPWDWRQRFLVEHWWGDSVFEIPSFAAVRTGATDPLSSQTLYVEYYDQNYDQMKDGEADPVQFRELYDLAQDPNQLQSLHRDKSRLPQMSLLRKLLSELKECGSSQGQSRCQELESGLSGLEGAAVTR